MKSTHLIMLVIALVFSGRASADVTLTLYVHDGSASGPVIVGARVTGQDAAGRSFDQTTNSSGYVTITGTPGTWQFSVSKSGYETNSWSQDINTTCERPAFLRVLSITAAIDGWLLDLIDQKAPLYFNSAWNLNIEQFKAWLATIAWAEGEIGGYGAHSGGNSSSLEGDIFRHKVIGTLFNFSTGIGPFQLDRGQTEEWHIWKTIEKLDPELAVESTARWHRDNRGSGSTLSHFANNSPWVAVRTPSNRWSEVTGTSWSAHSAGVAPLDWRAIKNQLVANAVGYSHLLYSNNVVDQGYLSWNITAAENILTETGRAVIFEGNLRTWLVRSRRPDGSERCRYYYSYRSDLGPHPVEVWVYDNSQDSDRFKYIFIRECYPSEKYGALPDHREIRADGYAYAGWPTLSAPAIITGETLSVSLNANPSSGPAPLNGVDFTATVSGTASATINYTFYANRSDDGKNITPDYCFKIDNVNPDGTGGDLVHQGTVKDGDWGGTPFTVCDVYNYTSAGTYTAKVIAERGDYQVESRFTITVEPASDTTAPTISAFSVTPSSVNVGDSFTISYTVSDTGGSGLKQVELWRSDGDGSESDPKWQKVKTNPHSGNGPVSGSFSDAPPSVGTYWYGLHVLDNASPLSNITTERQAGLGPLQRVVNPAAPTLVRIEVAGSTQVNENSGAQYTCTAYYSDGSTSNVTDSASWSEDSPYATISGTGYLTTSSVTSDQVCTVTATYSGYSDTHDVTIKDVPASLDRIEISGSTQVNESSGAQYTCTAYYSDGSTSNVTNSASWSQNSPYATISSTGYLTTSSVTSDQLCTITATYSGYSDTLEVTIKDVPPDEFWKSPTATGKSDNEWTNPTYAYSSDDNYATATGTYLEEDYYNFDFVIPANAIINGIEVKVEGHGEVGGSDQILVEIWSNSSHGWGTKGNGTGGWWILGDGSDSIVTGGNSTDLWGRTWQTSDFSNENFMARIKTFSNPDPLFVDHIKVRVYYIEPPPTCTISGYVRTPEGSGIAGVTMAGLPVNTITGNNGYYTTTVPYDWSGTVTPAKAGYIFDPNSRTYTKVAADQTADNYTGTPEIVGDFCGANFGPPDGYVDVWDLMQFADHWHTRTGEGNWDGKYDLTGPNFGNPDVYVDVWDLMIFADNWHKGQKP